MKTIVVGLLLFFSLNSFGKNCAPLACLSFVADSCATAVDISSFFAAATGVPQTTASYDNSAATTGLSEPIPACFGESNSEIPLNNSLWFRFTGNGGRFHLETVPCDAGEAYISGGDTQMSIFQGPNCDSLAELACNEDLYPDNDPDTDFRAGLDFQTVSGQTYFLLIDGFASDGVVATGLFCIEITRIPSVSCAEAVVGAYQIANNGYLCKGQNLLNTLSYDASTFVIPTAGLSGMSWVLTTQAIPAGVWPGAMPGTISTPLSETVVPLNLLNNITTPDPQVYYFTPVVVGGATLINAGLAPRLNNLNVSAGCFVLGETKVLTLTPVLEDLEGVVILQPAEPGLNTGSVHLEIHGGYPSTINDPTLYKFLWNTGDTSASLQQVAPGTYSVTVSDPSACVSSIALNGDVTVASSEADERFSMFLSPNPTSGVVLLRIAPVLSSELTLELLDVRGQRLFWNSSGPDARGEWILSLEKHPDGIYFLRVSGAESSVLRRLVLQH